MTGDNDHPIGDKNKSYHTPDVERPLQKRKQSTVSMDQATDGSQAMSSSILSKRRRIDMEQDNDSSKHVLRMYASIHWGVIPDLTSNFPAIWRQLSWQDLEDIDRFKEGNAMHRNMKIPIDILDWTRFIAPNRRQYLGGGSYGNAYRGEWINIPYKIEHLPEVVVKEMRVVALPLEDAEKRFKVHRTSSVMDDNEQR